MNNNGKDKNNSGIIINMRKNEELDGKYSIWYNKIRL